MDSFYALVVAGAIFSAVLVVYFIIKLVSSTQSVNEFFELLHWVLKTDYTPVEAFRQQVITITKMLFSELVGLEDPQEAYAMDILDSNSDLHTCEMCDELPKEVKTITTNDSSIGRRSTRRIAHRAISANANDIPQ